MQSEEPDQATTDEIASLEQALKYIVSALAREESDVVLTSETIEEAIDAIIYGKNRHTTR